MSVHVFGIRHHGPGSARALGAALAALQPDCLLIEGPPDAQAIVPLMMEATMQPPVALLIYLPDAPHRAVYYPFTDFSPEWQALRYGLSREIPTNFFDLPQGIQFASEPTESANQTGEAFATPVDLPPDPFALLATAAGFHDHEAWWEQQIEQRQDTTDLFAAVHEAMQALRAGTPPPKGNEALREAYMRQQIRAAMSEHFQTIAVVCGAWHTPALQLDGAETPSAKADAALLKGLPRVTVAATWIPWTNSRLALRSGYGAGITSPGWYAHLWQAPDRVTIRWMARVAQVLRAEGLDASAANVIEAVRLAEALAALRDLPMPGLAEMHEATQTVLCRGEETPMRLIRTRIEIGETLGTVPPATPAVPLLRDLTAQQRRLRLEMTPEIKTLDLDQRKALDLTRSYLLHRLHLLQIEWGKPYRAAKSAQGTFHEIWQLQWQVEFAVAIIEANVWGNTIEAAATAYARHLASTTRTLPQLTALLHQVILAALPAALDFVLAQVRDQAAVAADVQHLMLALPPLTEVARYTDVRQTNSAQLLPVISALFERVLVGLLPACQSLDDDAAATMTESIAAVQTSLLRLDDPQYTASWQGILARVIDDEGIHGLVRGVCCRLLLEAGILTSAAVEQHARHALSPATPAPQAAAWIEGVLRGNGEVVLAQDGLWQALDTWVCHLSADHFVGVLPLLRRAFAQFDASVRQRMGTKVKHLPTAGTATPLPGTASDHVLLDVARADLTLPILARLLGVAQ